MTRLVEAFKAYVDLTRAHFFFAWPLLFCSGLALAFSKYDGFSWDLMIKAAGIGLFGFEAGLVLNDYVDRDIDKKDVENDKLTRYWRLFKKRPIPSGLIQPKRALLLFFLFAACATVLIATLPYPNSAYVFIIMLYSYCAEYFYQVRKRTQRFPLAQLIGRTDFALFPVAGYLCFGMPDQTALLYFVFFYPWAIAHLGVNDLADERNDRARGLKTITTMYARTGTVYWIMLFTSIHFITASFFLSELGQTARTGFIVSLILLVAANLLIAKKKNQQAAMQALPIFHATMIIYAVSIILDKLPGII